MALTKKQRREFLERKKKYRFWKDLPLYVILLAILAGFGFLARWILEWGYAASFIFAALCAEFIFALLAYGIYALAKATKAKTHINPTRCLGFAIAGALGGGAMLIIKLAAGWPDWVACLIGLPVALIITGITFLVVKVKEFLAPGRLS
ncbi:MAG: hypothetical protein E3J72_13165 [Planctomycetota bacterium]|nr:MAG: hypothetical protein E3J72_13165 [Planctomycetota bacterium]